MHSFNHLKWIKQKRNITSNFDPLFKVPSRQIHAVIDQLTFSPFWVESVDFVVMAKKILKRKFLLLTLFLNT